MTFWISNWLVAFGATLSLELAVAFPMLRIEPNRLRRGAGIALVNFATHPIVWFVFPGLSAPHGLRIVSSELFAFAFEAGAYLVLWPQLGVSRALLVALLANVVSFGAGLLWHALSGSAP